MRSVVTGVFLLTLAFAAGMLVGVGIVATSAPHVAEARAVAEPVAVRAHRNGHAATVAALASAVPVFNAEDCEIVCRADMVHEEPPP